MLSVELSCGEVTWFKFSRETTHWYRPGWATLYPRRIALVVAHGNSGEIGTTSICSRDVKSQSLRCCKSKYISQLIQQKKHQINQVSYIYITLWNLPRTLQQSSKKLCGTMSSVGQICTLNCSKCPPPYSFQCRLSILSFFVQYNEKRIKLGAPRAIGEVASNICCNFECMISANPNFSFFLAHMLPKELFVFLKNVQETLKNRVCTGRWSPHIKQWELREAFFVHWSIFAEKSSDMSSIPALSLGEVIQISLPWENLNFIEGLASCCKCKNTARKWFLTCDPDEMLHHLMVYSPEVWGHGRQFPALKCIGIRSSQGKTGPFTQYICHGISLSLLTSFHLHGERIDTTWPWSWWGQAMPICKYWCC